MRRNFFGLLPSSACFISSCADEAKQASVKQNTAAEVRSPESAGTLNDVALGLPSLQDYAGPGNGGGAGPIGQHLLTIYTDRYTPVDSTHIPSGKLEAVAGTPFGFTKPDTIGARLDEKNEQLKLGGGYDHNFVLNGSGMKPAARVEGDRSGIVMEVWPSTVLKPGENYSTVSVCRFSVRK